MDQFPGNSHGTGSPKKTAPDKPVFESVVTETVIKRKKSLGQRFKGLFFGGDAKSAVRYVLGEVLVPAAKNMFVDSVEQGAKRMVYGDNAPRRNNTIFGQPRFSYNRPVERGSSLASRGSMLPDQPPHYARQRQRDPGEVIFASRDDAEGVLEAMRDIIEKYDVVSVADLNALTAQTSSYTDNSWGWSNLARVDIRQIREGYILLLPPVEQI